MSVIMRYKGQTAIIGCGGDYFAEGSICDIIKTYASTTIDYLVLPDNSKSCTSEAKDILNGYNVKNLYVTDKNELSKYSFYGNVSYTDKAVISLFNGEVLIAVEDTNGCRVAQVIFNNFKAIISFDNNNNLANAKGNLLICRNGLPNGVNAKDFNMIVVSAENNEKIWQTEYADNICCTADNGSISYLIKSNGTFSDWRAQ